MTTMPTSASHCLANTSRSVHPRNYGRPITVLCAARSSIYQAFPGLTIYTRSKDAWSANPVGPVIAHPPCRCWSRMRGLSSLTLTERILEMMLAFHCLKLVTKRGGILEQPAFSSFWRHANLPRCGDTSRAPGMWSLAVDQSNWGHRSTKPTWLLFCHIDPTVLLLDDWRLADVSATKCADLTPGQRSATPKDFAAFLLHAARTANPPRST
jgi:hypothetical protein